MTFSEFIEKVNGVTIMAVNMSEFVPDNNLNWLALAACVWKYKCWQSVMLFRFSRN